jgi:CubicO group peptidase (beta-lactamase class C family)
MGSNRRWALLLLAMTSTLSHGQSLPVVQAESVGLSSSGLQAITSALQAHVDNGDIAGAVAGVMRHGQLVYLQAVGLRDIESADPMETDDLFRIYSMTRPITSLAAMQLWEQGRLKLDDPIQNTLPEFTHQRVFVDARAPSMTQTRARRSDILLADLMRHTSGLGSRSSSIYVQEGVRSRDISLAQLTSNAARTPLFSDPGTEFRYGLSATVLGRVIEVIAATPYDEYLAENVFAPLGMKDTVFWVDPARQQRLATVYRPDENGLLRPHEMEDIPFTQKVPLVEGGVGLVSTVEDFLRFSQFYLDEGRVNGEALLQPETVAKMMENAIDDELLPIGSRGYMAASGWTLGGLAYVLAPAGYDHRVSEGEVWWDGSAGTRFWIDKKANMALVIMAQVSPTSGGGFREEFKNGVYKAILEPR